MGRGAQVGETRVVNLPGSTFGGDKERRLQVLVRAEGPTCVLSVTDLVVRLARRALHPASMLPHPRGPSTLDLALPSTVAAKSCGSHGTRPLRHRSHVRRYGIAALYGVPDVLSATLPAHWGSTACGRVGTRVHSQVHRAVPLPAAAETASGVELGWEPWSGAQSLVAAAQAAAQAAIQPRPPPPPPASLLLEVSSMASITWSLELQAQHER